MAQGLVGQISDDFESPFRARGTKSYLGIKPITFMRLCKFFDHEADLRPQRCRVEAPASMKRPNDSLPEPERTELEQQLESLRRDIRQLQLGHDLLKKANEIIKKGLGVDLHLLTNREKTMLVDALKETYALPELLAELGLARSSYFYHRARVEVADKYVGVRRVIA